MSIPRLFRSMQEVGSIFADRPWVGRCYEASALFIKKAYEKGHRGLILVLGVLIPQSIWPTPHAWVEGTRWVYDMGNNLIMEKGAYYNRFQARITAEYTFLQATIHMVQTEHYGPWEE